MRRKAPSIFFNRDEWKEISQRVKEGDYPSVYGYIKDLVLIDLSKDDRKDLLEFLCDRLGLSKDDLMRQAWKEFVEKHGLLKG